MSKRVLASLATAGCLFSCSAAFADTVAALIGDDTIALIDTQTKKAGAAMKVTGISGKILGIDVRPADGMLYALISDGAIVTLDPKTGKASAKSKLDMMLEPGVQASVDFNPVADRLRIIGSDGANLRANVDDGKVTKDGSLKFADTDGMKGKTAKVIAGAYTNSMKGAKETTLYDVDASGALLKQTPPNDGVLNTVGPHGVTGNVVAFDIAADAAGVNSAWMLAGSKLYKVDLTTGKGTEAMTLEGINGAVRDIAVMPAM
jgi:outer membrane protein assembly factor BamB